MLMTSFLEGLGIPLYSTGQDMVSLESPDIAELYSHLIQNACVQESARVAVHLATGSFCIEP